MASPIYLGDVGVPADLEVVDGGGGGGGQKKPLCESRISSGGATAIMSRV